MDMVKAIDDFKKNNENSFGKMCISIRKTLKSEESNFSEKGTTNIVAKLGDFLGAKDEKEKNESICNIAEILSNYDSGLYSVYEIEKKLFEFMGMKHPFSNDDQTV